jgi:hypothetical protein
VVTRLDGCHAGADLADDASVLANKSAIEVTTQRINKIL